MIQMEDLRGLPKKEIPILRRQFGRNLFHAEPSRRILHVLWDIVRAPMFILLMIACSLYFFLGNTGEGLMMFAAIILVAAISVYQEVKSSHALQALKQLTEPKTTVIREGIEYVISTEDLVPGDIILLSEGMRIPADALIMQANDLTINESAITGESLPVDKMIPENSNELYQGTIVNSGKCAARVTATGNNTMMSKIGTKIMAYQFPKTLLQIQLNRFVNHIAFFGMIGFLIIFLLNYLNHISWITSLLLALTLALSAVPNEIPVAFSSFVALGAYKMGKLGIISRQPQIIENLGAVSTICLDKTGTITTNSMEVNAIYDFETDILITISGNTVLPNTNVLNYAMLASEKDPFDPMEKGIWNAYYAYCRDKTGSQLKMIHEYPLEGRPPMMTHVYERNNSKIVAAKGAPERIFNICQLNNTDKNKLSALVKSLASKGYRVIGVASSFHTNLDFPQSQENFNWHFEGLVALYDPPKKNIAAVIKQFYDAKIQVKLLTGDYPETAMHIGGQVGIFNHLKSVTGEQVMRMKEDELKETAINTNIFARMFPDAKTKVIEALKANQEIVAMTGDGINDGPALKAASIGIAIGEKGTEIARQASDLIITDDDLGKMVIAISEGRKIFTNLKKAIRYIMSIHIPIVLIASMPLLLGWNYPNIFTPIHIIFLELIMGPTCSIFFEREPIEENNMLQQPRGKNYGLFTREELLISIIQGVIIALCTLSLYYYFMNQGASIEETRTIVFTTLILSNVFLTFTNRSFNKTIYYTCKYKNTLAPFILLISALFLACLHLIAPVRHLFQLSVISSAEFWLCLSVAFAGVMWFEVYKMDLPKATQVNDDN